MKTSCFGTLSPLSFAYCHSLNASIRKSKTPAE
jgi:hypothetical protein